MSYSKEEIINYRTQKAEEALEEAALLAKNEHWNTVINRLYYACFYIVSALLEKHDLEAKTHAGTKVLFNKHFLKEGIIKKDFGQFYAILFNKRQEGDYEDLQKFERPDIEHYLPKASSFVTEIKNHLPD